MEKRQSKKSQSGAVYIMRIATVLLAVVSWWATAQGMKDYVFEKEWQANLASLAVQGILLGLNFYLPAFWRNFKTVLGKFGIASLGLVVLFCSSWFSYVYISGKAYEQAWDMESRLLVESTYRSELYSAMDYVEEYQRVLQDSLNDQINGLYFKVRELETDGSPVPDTLDLEEDRAGYANNADFAARRVVAAAITAMESALRPDATANDRELAESTIAAQQDLVRTQIGALETQIEQTNRNINTASQQVRSAQERLLAAPAGTDTTALVAALESANRTLSTQQARLETQQAELSDYETAQSLLLGYASQLGLASAGSEVQIPDALRAIQGALLQSEINTEAVEAWAISIFEQLLGTEPSAGADASASQEMAGELYSFIRDVRDYAVLREITTELDALATGLREAPVAVRDGQTAWKTEWTSRVEALKSEVGGLPTYAGTESHALAAYSRIDAADRLDQSLLNYISDHNAADQALIYLDSPYNGLALFSLILAFFLDIAAFITGFVISAMEGKRKEEAEENEDRMIPAAARRCLYLTGNFRKEDGQYYHQVFEGISEDVRALQTEFQAGFYCEDEHDALQPLRPRELLFDRMSGGPADGVYRNCSLRYSDGILCIKKAGSKDYQFLAAVGEETPIFQMNGGGCTYSLIKDIPPQQWNTAVLALNGSGTRVAAVYLS